MAWDVSAIVFGIEYPLTGRDPFSIVKMDGLGVSGIIRRLKDRGPKQIGFTNLGHRIDARVITAQIIMVGDTLAEVDTARDLFTTIFSPWDSDDDAIELRFTRDDGEIRSILCHTSGGPDYPQDPIGDRMGASQRAVLQLECPDPLFYNPESVTAVFGSSLGGFAIPMVIPWASTGSGISEELALAYAGSYRSFPIFSITGPITNPVILNETTGEVLDFTGHSIAGGDTYTIDLTQEIKTVTDQLGVNQMEHLTQDSDLISWHLEPAPKAVGGINNLAISGTGITPATVISFLYFDRYLSL
jgi:hypothetical protein